MNESVDLTRIRIMVPVLHWARTHPDFFFHDGVISAESMAEQLMAGAQVLGATEASVHDISGGYVVTAEHDWFASARFPIPEDFNFSSLTPFPELGQNCVRPEFVVAAFAEQVVVRGPAGTHVVKGIIPPTDSMLIQVAETTGWHRAVAFRGLTGA
jgi:hypothetical protein